MQLRDWATSLGPWFPLAFLAAHIVVTVFPFPRTAFTLASGLLFGPWLGIGIAVVASTVSALPRCCWSAPPAGGSTALSPTRGSRPSTPGCASAAGRRWCRCG